MSTENLENYESDEKSEQEKPSQGRVVCSWCKRDMGSKDGLKEGEVSHGICSDCREKYFPKIGKK